MNAQDDGTERLKLFLSIHSQTTDDARLLQHHVLPSVEKVVKELMNTAMLYERFTFEKWRTFLPVQIKQNKQGLTLIHQVNTILASQTQALQDRKTQIDILVTEMKDEAIEINHSNVLLNNLYKLFDSLKQNILSAWDSQGALQAKRNREKLIRALELICKTLIPATSKFIDGLQECEEFFDVLLATLNDIQALPIDDEAARRHFEIMQKHAKSITASCSLYIINIASVTSDLDSIPKIE